MKLLLHVCCAPDLTISYKRLIEQNINPTLYFYNPNIHPIDEYKKRLNEVIKLKKIWYLENIEAEYKQKEFFNAINKNLNNNRCYECIRLRLKKSAEIAKKNNFENFSTTLFASPRKNHDMIKSIGEKIAKDFELNFMYFNFRANDGVKEAAKLCRNMNIYRQTYCGCSYSIFEAKKLEKISKEEKYKNLVENIGEKNTNMYFKNFKKDILKIPQDIPYSVIKDNINILKNFKPRIILIKKEIAQEFNMVKSGRIKLKDWKGKFIVW